MEKEIVAAQTLSAVGMVDYMAKVRQAEKEGWRCEGNPDVVGSTIYQTLIKENQLEEYK